MGPLHLFGKTFYFEFLAFTNFADEDRWCVGVLWNPKNTNKLIQKIRRILQDSRLPTGYPKYEGRFDSSSPESGLSVSGSPSQEPRSFGGTNSRWSLVMCIVELSLHDTFNVSRTEQNGQPARHVQSYFRCFEVR